MHTNKMVNGEQVALTAGEIAEFESQAASYAPPTPPAPTKEQLLAQLNALQAQIQALA